MRTEERFCLECMFCLALMLHLALMVHLAFVFNSGLTFHSALMCHSFCLPHQFASAEMAAVDFVLLIHQPKEEVVNKVVFSLSSLLVLHLIKKLNVFQ